MGGFQRRRRRLALIPCALHSLQCEVRQPPARPSLTGSLLAGSGCLDIAPSRLTGPYPRVTVRGRSRIHGARSTGQGEWTTTTWVRAGDWPAPRFFCSAWKRANLGNAISTFATLAGTEDCAGVAAMNRPDFPPFEATGNGPGC